MSTSTVEAPTASTSPGFTDTVQAPFEESFAIPVNITDGTLPTAKVCVPQELKYVSVVEGFDGTITWDLDVPTGVTAKFDNPPIQFYDGDPFTVTRVSDTQATIDWSNPNDSNRGKSFNYRINVVCVIDELLLLVSHDPTVHNDPPT